MQASAGEIKNTRRGFSRQRLAAGIGSRRLLTMLGVGLSIALVGCKDLTGSPGLPSGTPNPSFYSTPAGAIGMRNAAVFEVEHAFPQYILDAGLLSDELEDRSTGASPGALLIAQSVSDPLDERILPAGGSGIENGALSYNNLQSVRELANQAIGALVAYDTAAADTATSKVLRGELYAFEGYTEILLADLFCSGVPLSTLDFQKDFTYAASSTTAQVYHDALAKFDTALTVASASDSVVHLAQVGKGRAYLDLGQYAAAADDVTTVPDGFQYQLPILLGTPYSGCGAFSLDNEIICHATVSDREGHTGLSFLTGGDVRTAVDTLVQPNPGNGGPFIPLTFPLKYNGVLNGSSYAAFPLADWIEARLIQAEAALHAHDYPTWLTQLNYLRKHATVPGQTDTLATLADPGTDSARVSLLFQERAYWLFLTGHRQGDLRRLIRQYGRRQDQVYPTGSYLAPGTGVYGSDVNAPIPTAEAINPLFHGCIDRGA